MAWQDNSRGKILERDWSQFLLPPHKSVIPVNAQGEVGTEPELPAKKKNLFRQVDTEHRE